MNGSEVEGKLVIASERAEAIAAQIAGLEVAGAYVLSGWRTHRIRDVYFDTPERSLSRRETALRVRVEDGRELLTFKAQRAATGNLTDRLELEDEWSPETYATVRRALAEAGIPLPSPGDGGRLQGAQAALRSSGLRPSLARSTSRRSATVSHRALGQAVAELAVDEVAFELPSGAARHFEVECEAKGQGGAATVEEVLAALQVRFAELRPYQHSKLAIGEALEHLSKEGKLAPLLEGDRLRPEAYHEIDLVLRQLSSSH